MIQFLSGYAIYAQWLSVFAAVGSGICWMKSALIFVGRSPADPTTTTLHLKNQQEFWNAIAAGLAGISAFAQTFSLLIPAALKNLS